MLSDGKVWKAESFWMYMIILKQTKLMQRLCEKSAYKNRLCEEYIQIIHLCEIMIQNIRLCDRFAQIVANKYSTKPIRNVEYLPL